MSTPPSTEVPEAASRGGSPPGRTLVMVHGGGYKPEPSALEALWREALCAGLARDYADAGGAALLDGVAVALAFYGDLSNRVIEAAGKAPDPALDLEDRRRDLRRLTALTGRKQFRRVHYEAVPGKSAMAELVADVTAPVLSALRLTDPLLSRTLPSLAAYLAGGPGTPRGEFRAACEARLMDVLAPALGRGDDVLLLSHAMGSVVSYDVLWRLSHEPGGAASRRVHTWLTFGSPLASEYVKRNLRGAGEAADRCYPDKVVNWLNVAAEDDYHCHDKTVANDFAALLRQRRISQIRDYRIYNLAIRYGRSNPHNAVGYLIHPRLTRIVADWLGAEPGAG